MMLFNFSLDGDELIIWTINKLVISKIEWNNIPSFDEQVENLYTPPSDTDYSFNKDKS